MPPEAIAKTAAALRGRKQSKEHLARLSLVRKGRIPMAAVVAAAQANRGHKQSPEHIKARFAAVTGRGRPGNRKLTDEQVRTIRAAAGDIPQRTLAKLYGIGTTMIHAIQHRRRYADVQDQTTGRIEPASSEG